MSTVYLKPSKDWDWMVWVGDQPDETDPGEAPVTWFRPGTRGGYYLDAYSYARTLADKLGCGLREAHQDK
jgi:hypothetical protein